MDSWPSSERSESSRSSTSRRSCRSFLVTKPGRHASTQRAGSSSEKRPLLTRCPALDRAPTVSIALPFVNAYHEAGLEALGDPTRREIFERLSRRPLAVGELAGELPISRPAVSQHLRVLKDAGLVFDRPAA